MNSSSSALNGSSSSSNSAFNPWDFRGLWTEGPDGRSMIPKFPLGSRTRKLRWVGVVGPAETEEYSKKIAETEEYSKKTVEVEILPKTFYTQNSRWRKKTTLKITTMKNIISSFLFNAKCFRRKERLRLGEIHDKIQKAFASIFTPIS